jgi:hypothetical protein
MTKDFIAIGATTLLVGIGVWTLRHDPHAADPQTTETVRFLADDPALKLATEHSPYMRSER